MKKLGIILFLFLNFLLNAQIITGKIWSKFEQKPIPYANIGVENNALRTLSDEDGNFSLNLSAIDKNSNLIIEVSGYEAFKMNINKLNSDKIENIYLKEKIVHIEEVKINPKKYVDKNWGNKTTSKSIQFGYSNSIKTYNDKDISKTEFAVLFKTNKKVKVQKINLSIADIFAKEPIFLRYTFYDRNMNVISTSDLTDEISKDRIINNVFTSDISKENVWMNQDFYLGLQVVSKTAGGLYICGAFFGNKTVSRKNEGGWEKIPAVTPALNIDIKVEK